MNEATKHFFAKLYIRQPSSDDYVDWAIACLEDGLNSKNLCILAATDKSFYTPENETRFRRALDELGWKYLSKKEALLFLAKDLAKKIISGELLPVEGCTKINKLALILDYADELRDWLLLVEGIDPMTDEWISDPSEYPAIKSQKWFEVIIREAKKLAETDFS